MVLLVIIERITNKGYIMTEKELIELYMKEYGVTICPTKPLKQFFKNTTTRSKKCMTYNTTSPMGIRTMNFESTYNTPTTYNGVKMMMDHY